MTYRTCVRTALSAAAVLGAGWTAPALLAQSAGSTDSIESRSVPAEEVLTRAAALIESGRVVRAQQALLPLATGGAAELLSDTERARAAELLTQAATRLKTMDPLEVSLQRAEAALDAGDLRTADAQSAAVSRSAKATQAQIARASELKSQADAMRAELTLRVPSMLDQAVSDFAAGRYVEAKASLGAVRRSGVTLTAKQSTLVEAYQGKILDLEQAQGHVFNSSTVAAGMMQPGVVKKPEPKPAPKPAEPAPAPEPSAAPVQPPPTEAPKPAEPPAQPPPETLPAPAPAPAATQPPPADQDLVQQGRRYNAQSLRAEADADFAQSRYNTAVAKYTHLLSDFRDLLTPTDVTEINQRIDEARVRMGAGSGGAADPLRQVIEQNQVIRQRAIAEFANQESQARREIASGNVEAAHDLAVAAKLTITNARNAFSESELEEYMKRVDALLRDVDNARTELARQEAVRRSEESKKIQEAEQKATAEKREAKIREAVARARELQQQMDYDSALQVVNEQILFLDPVNPAGLILRDLLMDAKTFTSYYNIRDRVQRSVADQALENYRAMVAPHNIIEYPADWPAISQRRGGEIAYADTEENRRVRTALTNHREPVDFGGVRLADAIGWVREVGHVGVDVDWSSLEGMQVTPDTPVTLQVTHGVPLKTVLDRIVQKVSPDTRSRVGWTVEDGIVTVASEEVLRKNTPVVIYDIKDLLIEIPDYADVPQFDLTSVLRTSQGGGTGASPFHDPGGTDRVKSAGGTVRRTRDERVHDIVDIIEQHVDPEGWKDLGGSTGSIQELNGSLIITNTPTNHQAISGLLAKLREVRAMQINVETRFLLVSTEFFEGIGFDFDVFFNANNNQVTAARTTAPATTAADFFNSNTNPGIYNRLLSVPGTAPPGTASNFAAVPPRNGFSPVGVTQNSIGQAASLLGAVVDSSSVAGQLINVAPAMGISGQFLDDVQVDFLITATQADRRAVRLNAPRLTFTNGQTSNIYVVTQTAFVSDLTPVVSDSAVGFDPTTNAVSEGAIMIVEGTVSADRRYVTLNVQVSVNKLDQLVNFPVTAVAGGRLVSSADTSSFIQLPTVTVTSVATTVTVPDQGTVLLGGQRITNEFEVESGVPVLSKIPIINRFFSNRVQARDEQTLLILLKPTILIQSENEDQNFPGLIDALRTPFAG